MTLPSTALLRDYISTPIAQNAFHVN